MGVTGHPRSSRRRARGFTLIELMVVVVIIGVLAALAVVGYRKLVDASHVNEATNVLQSIRVAQEAYHGEALQYANISATPQSLYPQAQPTGKVMTAWGGVCSNCNDNTTGWSVLPVRVDGPVLFGYSTVAGVPGTGPGGAGGGAVTVGGQSMTFPATPTTDWYVAAAVCDLDGQGLPNTVAFTTSWSNQVFVFNAGQ